MAADAGWNGKFTIDSGSETEVANVSNASPSISPDELDVSVFNDEGKRRIYGQQDFSISVDLYFDFTETTHTDILDAILNETELTCKVYPDRDVATYFEATCKVFSEDGDFSVGSADSVSLTFQNSDGSKWSYTTA